MSDPSTSNSWLTELRKRFDTSSPGICAPVTWTRAHTESLFIEAERLRAETERLQKQLNNVTSLAGASLTQLHDATQRLIHEPEALRDALDAIASPADPKDYGWWTQVARRALGCATKNETAQPPSDVDDVIHESTRDEQKGLLNPIQQVWFRAGLLACRAYMAAFVEQGGDKNTADSIRANWWPSLGEDPGPPRQNTFQELTVGEYGEPGFRVKGKEEVSASIEALPVALGFLQGHCGWPVIHYRMLDESTSPGKEGGQ